jgi:hypothetical protein
VLYRIDVAKVATPLEVRAELLYQATSFAFIRDLLTLRDKAPEIERFAKLYEAADKEPVVVARAEMAIPAPVPQEAHGGGQS